jgi:hypothetical protein
MEASNALIMPGRIVAKPGEKSENPGIELEPQEMQALIDKDRASFMMLAHGLYDQAAVLLKAIDAKDKEAVLEAGDPLDRACESCHLKYWYPNEVKPGAEAKQ